MFGKDCALIGCNMYFLGLFWLCRFGAVLGVCLTWDRYVEWIFALSRREALKNRCQCASLTMHRAEISTKINNEMNNNNLSTDTSVWQHICL